MIIISREDEGDNVYTFIYASADNAGAAVAQSVYTLGYRLDYRGSIPGRCNYGIFSLRLRVQTDSSLVSNGYRAERIIPGIKQPGRETDHSPASSAKDKNS
jgi:hypothetical protein